MATISIKPCEIKRKWYLVDATNKTLGRLASQIAHILQGKHKPEYTPHLDLGDYIVVKNAEKVRVTGNKRDQKCYYKHTQYPGGLKVQSLKTVLSKYPERVIRAAVENMLPTDKPLGRAMFRKLKVYAGEVHHHEAQQPEVLEIRC